MSATLTPSPEPTRPDSLGPPAPPAPPDTTSTTGRRGVLFAMCLSLVLVVASVSALNLALPDIAIDLGASNGALTWIADGYTVALAALVLPLGALGDRLGRRHVLVAGCAVFGVAALGASVAGTTDALIAARVVMGIGAAMIMPGTLATITTAFPPEERRKGVATWAGFAAAGAIIGLLAAGLLLERWGWGSIFVASAVVAALSLVAALVLAPNTRESHEARFDVLGSGLSAVGIGSLVFAIIEGAEQGWTEAVTLVAGAIALTSIVGYVIASLGRPDPLLDPRLFRRRGFSTGAVIILVQFMAVFGFFFVGLQFLQLMLGYSALEAAVALVPVGIVVLPVSQLTPRLVRTLGIRWVAAAGLLLMAAGMWIVSTLGTDATYPPFLAGLVVVGLGMGIASSTGTAAIVGALPSDQQGVASAMNDATREVGAALGIAVMGAAYGSAYRAGLPAVPAGTPAEIVEAVQGSAAAGLMVADRIGGPVGDQIATTVRAAFIDGLSSSSLVIAAILGIAAIAVAVIAPSNGSADDPTIV